MKKLITLLFLFAAFTSNAQRTMFGSNNNYVVPLTPFQAPAITTGEITTGLLLYLNAGNTSSYSGNGNTWYDLSGNNNHGTLKANGSGASPIFGNGSFAFNGSSSYVSIESSVIPNTGSFTVSSWAKMPPGAYIEMINTRNPLNRSIGFLLTSTGSDIRAQIINPNENHFAFSGAHSTIQDNTWHLITITFNETANTMAAYVDKYLIDTKNIVAGSLVGQGYFSIGWDYAWNGQPFYLGSVATVSVYNYALSSTNVTTNFDALKTRFGL